MNIIVDTREPGLYDKFLAEPNGIAISMKPLLLGDIGLYSDNVPILLFERKSLSDLLSSIKDGRYVEQSHRLIHTSEMHTHNIVYIIEGMFSQLRTPLERRMCLSAMTSLSYYKGFSVFRTCSLHETADLILSMSAKIQKERQKGSVPAFSNFPKVHSPKETESSREPTSLENPDDFASSAPTSVPAPYCEVVHKVKKDNITPENIGEIILCTIPGISSTTAMEIMKQYQSFPHFMKEIESHPESLSEIRVNKRKLGKNVVDNILRFLRSPPEVKP